MKVFIFLDHFCPGFRAGGPIRVIASILEQNHPGYDIRVITTDRDLGDVSPYPNTDCSKWLKFGSGMVMYLPKKARSFRSLVRLIADEKPDLVHLNSFFSARFTLPIILARRLGFISRATRFVVSPHGEFSPEALNIKKRRKFWFLKIVRISKLYRETLFHATSVHEVSDILRQNLSSGLRSAFVRPPLSVKLNGISSEGSVAKKDQGVLKLVFLSRISEMKNLDFLIDLLNSFAGSKDSVTPATTDDEISLDIYGPIQASDLDYWKKCQQKIERLPASIEVRYLGAVESERVTEILSRYHLFVLPTLGENFGYAILESLAAGCPILISDRTPWIDLPSEIGYALPLENPSSWLEALKKFQRMDAQTWVKSTTHAKEFVKQVQAQSADFTELYDETTSLSVTPK